MSLLPKSVDYSDKDFDSIRLRLQKAIRSVYPDWTDFQVSNFGNLLLESFAFVADVLLFYQDNQAREAFLPTATQRKNLLALCKLIGYRPPSSSAAQAPIVLTLDRVPAADVTIPAGTTFRTADSRNPVDFQLLGSVVIPAGANPPVAAGTVENSRSYIENFGATGLANQEIVLSRTPYIEESASVFSGAIEYTEAPNGNFLQSGPLDRHYVVVVDQADRATLKFGNGINGSIPTEPIVVSYSVGGGVRGNVEPNAIRRAEGVFSDEHGNRVQVSCTNPERARGGVDRLSTDQIRLLAPESIRTIKNSVTREDFENNARRLPEVARALMLTSNELDAIEENAGTLFIVPRDGDLPSEALKAKVLNYIKTEWPPMLTFRLQVQGALIRRVNIRTVVYPRSSSAAARVEMKNAIVAALQKHFSPLTAKGTPNPDVGFGFEYKDSAGVATGEIPYTDILNIVRDVPSVRKLADGGEGLLINGRSESVFLNMHEFPMLGDVVVIDGTTGAAI